MSSGKEDLTNGDILGQNSVMCVTPDGTKGAVCRADVS